MDQRTKPALVAAVAAGYVLGRTKKGKLALTAVALATGRSTDPVQLIAAGVRRLRGTPAVDALVEQVRGEVYQALRAAAGAALTRRFGPLGGVLGEAAASAAQPRAAAQDAPGAKDAEDPEEAGDAPEGREPDGERAPARRKGAPKRQAADRAPGRGQVSGGPRKTAASPPAKRARRTPRGT